jgi:hypothetical protein
MRKSSISYVIIFVGILLAGVGVLLAAEQTVLGVILAGVGVLVASYSDEIAASVAKKGEK